MHHEIICFCFVSFCFVLFFISFFVSISKERQFRVEQREADGSVRGEYGYIDQNGKVHLTKYRASESEGFKAEEVST